MNSSRISMVVAIILIVVLTGCNDERLVAPDDGRATISGKVLSQECGLDFHGIPPIPYHDYSDKPATVQFVEQEGGSVYTASSDKTSTYTLRLQPGTYEISSFSYHWKPSVHSSVLISNDTTIDIQGTRQWWYSDVINIVFYYPEGDTLSSQTEMELIRLLNAQTGFNVVTTRLERSLAVYDLPDRQSIFSHYGLFIRSSQEPWKVEHRLSQEIEENSEIFPESMHAFLNYLACID